MKRKSEIGFGLKAAVLILLSASFFTCRIGVKESGDGGNKTGIGTPTPANGTQNVSVNPTLSWDFPAVDGKTGITYDVFLSTNNPPQTVLVRDLSSTSYTASGLTPGATYYWRVDYLDGSTVVNGPVWSFTVTTDVNDPPVFTGLRDTTINEGQELRLTLSAPDPDGDSVTYSMTGGPQGATLSGNAFAWTPNFSQSGVHQIRFIAQDDGSPRLSDTANIRVTVSNVSAPPVLQQPRDTTVNEGQTLRITLSASDPDGDALVYSMSNSAPSGTALAGNVFTWTPDTNQAGTFLIDFTVTEQTADSLRDTKTARIVVRDVGTTAGLVAYWDFNEGSGTTLMDRSGNGNDGTINGGATWVNGIDGGALSFDGVDDYVRVPDAVSLDITGELSISCWIRFIPSNAAGAWTVISKWGDQGDFAGQRSYQVRLIDSARSIDFNLSGSSNQNDVGFHNFDNVLPIGGGSWIHIVMTFDRTTRSVYVNGGLLGSTSKPDVIFSGIADLGIGAKISSSTQPVTFYHGLVDEIHLYNRALTAAEIAAEWDKYKDKIPPTNGLVAYWPFSGNANDASGNGNNGTVNGAMLAADRFGNANSAYSFDGTDYISVPDAVSLDITGSISISGWVNFGAVLNNYETLLGKRPASANQGNYALRTGSGTNSDEFQFYWSTSASVWNVYTTNNANLVTNTWYHVAITYNDSVVNIYKDGILLNGSCSTGSCNTPLLADDNILRIGQGGEFPEYLSGISDDIRIYNRTLSSAEVQVLYNEGR